MATLLTDRLGIELPIVQAPMAGFGDHRLAAAVSDAGGLGSLPCALLTPDEVRSEVAAIRATTNRPFNLNFFCHTAVEAEPAATDRWLQRLAPYYGELGIEPTPARGPSRTPFDDEMCAVVEEVAPAVVSFHFGLPEARLIERVRGTGATIMSSATTVAEARWLVEQGCDLVIAQGLEAGGHRGMFLTTDTSTQVGTMALVPQVVDAVDVPIVAAGGIADGRGIAAALTLGAAGVQLGTAFLRTPEALTSPLHRSALAAATEDATVLTNVFSGRPARSITNRLTAELGPLSEEVPPFPLAAAGTAPLRAAAEAAGSSDYSSFWSGQAALLGRELPAGDLVRALAAETDEVLRRIVDR